MLGTGRMADIHVLDFRPAIDQNGLRVVVQKIVGGLGGRDAAWAYPKISEVQYYEPKPAQA